MNIEKLVKDFPNDAELGREVRHRYFEATKDIKKFLKKYKDSKIYESPDGGQTVYVRGFGKPLEDRKLVTNQLTIFDDAAYKESK
jgi:hypothetical protein